MDATCTRWMHHSSKNAAAAACTRDTTTPMTTKARVKPGGQRYALARVEEFALEIQMYELYL